MQTNLSLLDELFTIAEMMRSCGYVARVLRDSVEIEIAWDATPTSGCFLARVDNMSDALGALGF